MTFGPSTPRSPYTSGGPAMWSSSSNSSSSMTPPQVRPSPSKRGSPSTPRTLMRRIACMSERQKICLMMPFSLYICYSIYCDLLVYFAPRALPFPPEINHQNAKQRREKFLGPDLWSIATITFNAATPNVVELNDHFGLGDFDMLTSSHGRRARGNFGLQSDTTTGPNGLSLFPDAERPVDPNNPLDKKVQKPHSLPKGCDWDSWQTTVHPTCNNVHTMPMLDLVLEDSVQAPGLPSFFFGGSRLTGIYRSSDESLVAYKTLRPEMIFGEREHQKAMVEAIAYEQYSPAAVGIFDQCAVSFVTEFADGGVLPEHMERTVARQCDTDEIRSCQTECISGPDANECRGNADCEKSCLYECCYGRSEKKSNSTLESDAISADDLRLAIDLTSIVVKLHEHHSTPLIHRDLDPANVVFVNGRAKVIDFNEGRMVSHRLNEKNGGENSATAMPAPVPCYPKGIPVGDNIDDKPLEIIQQDVVNEKVDVYQLGALFFYILTRGARVYHCENPKGACTWGDRHENSIPDEQVRHMKKEGILPSLPKHIAESEDEFIRAIVYNMEAAMHHDESQRPTSESIMESLTAAIESKPYYHATGSGGSPTETNSNGHGANIAFIHVGPRMTGSSTIQGLFGEEDFRESLEEDGIATISGHTLARCIQDEMNPGRKSHCDKAKMEKLSRKIEKIRKSGRNLLFSCESIDLLRSKEEFDMLERTFLGFDVHVIVVYRRFFEWLPSFFAGTYRTVPAEEFETVSWSKEPQTRGKAVAEWGLEKWIRSFSPIQTYDRYLDRFGHHNVSLVNPYKIGSTGEHGDVVSSFFCLGSLNASRTCNVATSLQKSRRKNVGRPLEYDMIAMAAKSAGIIDPHRVSRSDLRRYIQMRQEKTLNLTLNDLPRQCSSNEMKSVLLNISLGDESRAASVAIPYGLQPDDETTHGKTFEAHWTSKFCLVDTEAILSDSSWRTVLSDTFGRVNNAPRDAQKIGFFLAGSATKSLKESLLALEEISISNNEHELCASGERVSEVDKNPTSTPGQQGKLRGQYCPTLIRDPEQLKTLASSFGIDRMVFGLRHPVLFFQDLYNHRVSNFHPRCDHEHQEQSSFSSLEPFVRVSERNKYQLLSTQSALYEQALNGTAPSIKVFLYASEQLDKGPSKLFRENLENFLGMSQSFKEKDQGGIDQGGTGEDRKNAMNICEEKFTGLRESLLKHAGRTIEFILEEFIAEQNVKVGDLEQFRAIVTKWSKDPCSSGTKNQATVRGAKTFEGRTEAFAWSLVDFSRVGLCGGYKCFFYGNSDDVGYLISRTMKKGKSKDVGDEIYHTWRLALYLQDEFGLRHTLLAPPERVIAKKNSPLFRDASLTEFTQLHGKWESRDVGWAYQEDRNVVIQQVRVVPRDAQLIKGGLLAKIEATLNSIFELSPDKSQFIENFSKDIQSTLGAFRFEPLLAIDFQIMVDTLGNVYHVDLDRIFSNSEIYQSEFLIHREYRHAFRVFEIIDRWLQAHSTSKNRAHFDLGIGGVSSAIRPKHFQPRQYHNLLWESENSKLALQDISELLDAQVTASCNTLRSVESFYRQSGLYQAIQDPLVYSMVADLMQRIEVRETKENEQNAEKAGDSHTVNETTTIDDNADHDPTPNVQLKVAICLQAKNEALYLGEWIEHHAGLGFDSIFIANGGSRDETQCVMDAYARDERFHVLRLPEDVPVKGNLGSQQNAYRLCQKHLVELEQKSKGADAWWMLTHDTDEFIWIDQEKGYRSIQDVLGTILKDQPAMQNIKVPRYAFGSSGQEEYQPGFVMDRFIHRYDSDLSCRDERARKGREGRRRLTMESFTETNQSPCGRPEPTIDQSKAFSRVSALANECYVILEDGSRKRRACHSPHNHVLQAIGANASEPVLRDHHSESRRYDGRHMFPEDVEKYGLLVAHYQMKSRSEYYFRMCESVHAFRKYGCEECSIKTQFDTFNRYANVEDLRMIPFVDKLRQNFQNPAAAAKCRLEWTEMPCPKSVLEDPHALDDPKVTRPIEAVKVSRN